MPRVLLFSVLLLSSSLIPGCSDSNPRPSTQSMSLSACLEPAAQEAATQAAGMVDDVVAITPQGKRLSPVGRLVTLADFPHAVKFAPDCLTAFVVHSGNWTMEVIDVASGSIAQTLSGVGGFRGLTLDESGKNLYTADSLNGTVSRLEKGEAGWEVIAQTDLNGVPIEVVHDAVNHRVIAVSSSNSKVWELDDQSLEVLTSYVTGGVFPYAAVISTDGTRLYVSHVGDDSVRVLKRSDGSAVATVYVGHNPMGMVLDARGRLFTANSDSDTISVISESELQVIDTIQLGDDGTQLSGGGANELVLDASGDSLLVSYAEFNRVDRISLETLETEGSLPTGRFPTGMALCRADETSGTLAVLSSRGWAGAGGELKRKPGILSLIDYPISDEDWASWTQIARDNFYRTDQYYNTTCPDPIPLPLDASKPQVIEHVVLIVRENKTYDAVMGDFERGDGDPELLVFGEEVTPNLHQLAREFVNMDNYYADAEASAEGHTWTTQALANSFFIKVYPKDLTQTVVISWDPSTIQSESSIFDHFYEHGVSFRSYGEIESVSSEMLDVYHEFVDLKYPFFTMSISDVWKAEEFIRELNLGIFPEFIYLALPNDHTSGTKAGFPTPTSMVADNDEATGMVVDAISRSPYWDKTAIFIIEDDPQGYGGDHVHPHRSICVVASPWVKRGYTSSVNTSIPALYRTIEMLLRAPPMHRLDAFATPMYDIFLTGQDEEVADLTPYDSIPRNLPVEFNTEESPMARESALMDFSLPDRAPGLGKVLWRHRRGDDVPPPYAKWNDE